MTYEEAHGLLLLLATAVLKPIKRKGALVVTGLLKDNTITVAGRNASVGIRRNERLKTYEPVLILHGNNFMDACYTWDHLQGLRFDVRDAWTTLADKEGMW